MNNSNSKWEAVIGLEIHVQLSTNSKLFSGASTNFGASPNTQACNVDLAMPGVLPVLNEEVLKMAIKLGIALNANINSPTSFARKNYFYPDSPKGYQISQMDKPIVEDGFLDIELENSTIKRVGVTRAHLEEDAGKSLHEGVSGLNSHYLGIELLVPGVNDYGSFSKKINQKGTYSKAQFDTTVEVFKYWMKQYNIPVSRVVRHSDVSGDHVRGKNKGNECGKNCKLGYDYCGTHYNKYIKKEEQIVV